MLARAQVIAMGQVVAGANGWTPLRGVFMLKDIDDLKGAVIFADAPHPGLTVTLDKPLFYGAANLSSAAVVPTLPANITDVYQPCSLPPDHGHTAVYAVQLPAGRSDVLSVELCSHGGYDQARRLPLQTCSSVLGFRGRSGVAAAGGASRAASTRAFAVTAVTVQRGSCWRLFPRWTSIVCASVLCPLQNVVAALWYSQVQCGCKLADLRLLCCA